MSLNSLLTNYMTIETCEGANQTSDGAINRAASWSPIPQFKNILCNIQEKSRKIVNAEYGIVEELHENIAYHTNVALYNYAASLTKNQTLLRVITNRNPRNSLVFPVSLESINIFMFRGHIEQISCVRGRVNFFVLRLERSNKWNY